MIKKTVQQQTSKIRVAPSLDEVIHAKLIRLGVACGLNKTAMAEQIIAEALNDEEFIHKLQHLNDAKQFRIVTARIDGKLKFLDANNNW